jgi:CP family cyanate transporter-like MFS transporter
MGLFAPPAQRLAARIGAEWALAMAFVLMSLAEAMRLAASNAAVLFISSAVVGAAMGATSALVPALIGHHVVRARGLATGMFSVGVAAGTGLASYLAVPLATGLGGWERSIASWSVPAGLAALCWIALIPRMLRGERLAGADMSGPRRSEPVPESAPARGLPWRSPIARWVTVFVSLQSLVAFSGVAWLIPTFRDVGWSPSRAATMFVVFQAAQGLSMLLLPYFADRMPSKRPAVAASVICTVVGLFALAVAPAATALPATVLFGIGLGGGFSMGFILIVDCTRSKADAARLGAMVFLVAYAVAALGPLAVGLLHDITGGFRAGFLVMTSVGVVQLGLVVALRPGRTIADARRP